MWFFFQCKLTCWKHISFCIVNICLLLQFVKAESVCSTVAHRLLPKGLTCMSQRESFDKPGIYTIVENEKYCLFLGLSSIYELVLLRKYKCNGVNGANIEYDFYVIIPVFFCTSWYNEALCGQHHAGPLSFLTSRISLVSFLWATPPTPPTTAGVESSVIALGHECSNHLITQAPTYNKCWKKYARGPLHIHITVSDKYYQY